MNHDAIASALSLVQVSVLTGIFWRLGGMHRAHTDFRERLTRLEGALIDILKGERA